MRALCLTNAGESPALEVIELPAPVLQSPHDVRIGVHAAALNHLDLFVAQGKPGLPKLTFPHIVASDAAGVVLEVGSAVTHVQPGDRVVVNPGISCGACEACLAGEEVFCKQFSLLGEHRSGTAAEEIVIPGKNVLAVRGDWTWAAAAAFSLSTLTAWRMLTTRAQLKANENVLIWGIGGGIASTALQIARHLGAHVAVTSSAPEKLERAKALGAEFVINHRSSEDVPGAVKKHFGRGVDVVVDTIGEPTWDKSFKVLRPGGRLVTCGATGGHDVGIDIRRLFWFQWSILGSTMGTSREFAEVVALGEANHLRPQIDAVFPMADGKAAYQRMADGKQFGKLVIEVTP